MRNVLIRLCDNGIQTLGEWRVYKEEKLLFECKTLELAYRDNEPNKSCIPKGTYLVKKRRDKRSKFKYPHLHIQHVVNRKYILVHIGNYHTQIAGCILPGNNFMDINKDGQKDVLNSAITFNKLMEVVPESFVLEVV